ncbi:MAG: PEP-CTERM sorting domain-containing protein [Acidobacteriaceae bacterium]|nr:PEP-CTERM sorting domain-containing protein [Acidobacteriaceae bacterium]
MTYSRQLAQRLLISAACLLSSSALGLSETIGNLSYWATPGVEDGYAGTQAAIGAWNGPLNPAGYTVPAPTVGQVITAPADGNTVLQSFTVAMPGSPVGFQMNMTAAVFAWNTADFRPVGPALASVPTPTPQMIGPAPYLNNFYNLTFSPDVQLSPGSQYVVLFSTLGITQQSFYDADSFGVTLNDTYSGGEMVFASAGALHESSTPLSAVEGERWGETNSCDQLQLSTLCLGSSQGYYFQYPGIVASDLAFAAVFGPAQSAVPEPSTFGMLGIACLAGLVCRVLSRRAESLYCPLRVQSTPQNEEYRWPGR